MPATTRSGQAVPVPNTPAAATTTATLLQAAHEVAADEGVGDAYRVVFNTGTGAGQTVFHIHAHVIGGRNLEWPPG